MNDYVREYIDEWVRRSVEYTVGCADNYGRQVGHYMDGWVSHLNLQTIDRQLEAELEHSRFVPRSETQRKPS